MVAGFKKGIYLANELFLGPVFAGNGKKDKLEI